MMPAASSAQTGEMFQWAGRVAWHAEHQRFAVGFGPAVNAAANDLAGRLATRSHRLITRYITPAAPAARLTG
jgi:hypothetical protein